MAISPDEARLGNIGLAAAEAYLDGQLDRCAALETHRDINITVFTQPIKDLINDRMWLVFLDRYRAAGWDITEEGDVIFLRPLNG